MPELPAALSQFRTIVYADPKLQRELRQVADRAAFIDLVVERCRQHGCAVDAAAIEAALREAARAWMLRWIA
jgi:hypothetical protein